MFARRPSTCSDRAASRTMRTTTIQPGGTGALAAGCASIKLAEASAQRQAIDTASKSLGPPPPFSSILKRKADGGFIKKSWRSYFFTLDDSGIAWYANEAASEQRSNAKGRVVMHQLLGAEAAPDKGECRFVIHVRPARAGEGNTSIEVDADSKAIMQRWLELISRHLHERSEALTSNIFSTLTAAAAGLPASAAPRSRKMSGGSIAKVVSGKIGSARRLSMQMVRSSKSRSRKNSAESQGSSPSAANSFEQQPTSTKGAAQKAKAEAAAKLKELTSSPRGSSEVIVDVSDGGAGTGEAEAKAADAVKEAIKELYIGDEANRKILAIPGNSKCADCITSDVRKQKDVESTWGSTNLGVTFCIRCSGVHRRMGAHVTKVLSLTIDSWTHTQIEHMRTLGNDVVNAELEASLPEGVKPEISTCTPAELEAFIRAKYELGSFKAGGGGKLAEVKEAKAMEGEAAAGAAKAMAEFCGLLIIRLIRATGLSKEANAYVVCSLGERKAKSKTIKNSTDPAWNETMMINVRNLSESLILKIYDSSGMFSGNEFIGQALIPLADLTHDGHAMGFDLTLEKAEKGGLKKDGNRMVKKGGASGSVAIELTYNPLDR